MASSDAHFTVATGVLMAFVCGHDHNEQILDSELTIRTHPFFAAILV
jgi:hypothetical protein